MNRRTDREDLLADVLAEEAQAGFIDALLDETLRLARRRRQRRQLGRARAVTLVALLAGLGIWRSIPRGKPAVEIAQPQPAPAPFQLVVSQPLPETQLVNTRPLSVKQLLAVEFTIPTIRTFGGGFREVGDDELLALAAPQTAALIRRGPNEAQLVIVPLSEEPAHHQN